MISRLKDRILQPETIGIFLVLVGFAMLVSIYSPLLKEEFRYRFFSADIKKVISVTDRERMEGIVPADEQEIIYPVDEEFGIVIPRISANANVIADVDPNDPAIYQRALTRGVAHADGTSYPGEEGNVFIFAHSGVDFPEALRYNAVFYLLGKLEERDNITIFYEGKRFEYAVSEKKIVNADEVGYLKGDPQEKTLTLMTCWPAGTTLKRLVVIAEQI
ncbi:MAG: Sortase family protein [Parcubacteria group bacterium GW2011_GWC1_45_14]|nr:MAG: Sortase family protein [Parcubacteria group bacterium GW2011_GWC1_45_14]